MILQALRYAFPYTIPILGGFYFIGFAYGFYMNALGFSFVYPMLMSLVIFAGSLELIAATMMLSTFAPVSIFVTALIVQARHIFYGLSMLEKFRGIGLKKYYIIFGMCDESFALNFTSKLPGNIDRGWFYFWITFLNHFYWVSGSTLGGLLSNSIAFEIKGLEFVMTALFTVIFVDHLLKSRSYSTAAIGLLCTISALVFTGKDNFLLISMGAILTLLLVFRKYLSVKECN
ncbi:MAG: AzlC family ABC transporter permease [Succinivibrio sp.]